VTTDSLGLTAALLERVVARFGAATAG